MQVLIRRKGVSLRAQWDGLAKPTHRHLHYWLRTTPNAPVANNHSSGTITDVLRASPVASHGVGLVITQASGDAAVVLYRNAIKPLVRPAEAPVVGVTSPDATTTAIVNYAAGGIASYAPSPSAVSEYTVCTYIGAVVPAEGLSFSTPVAPRAPVLAVSVHANAALAQLLTTPFVRGTLSIGGGAGFGAMFPATTATYPAHAATSFAGQDFAKCYQVAANQVVAAVTYRMAMLSVAVSNTASSVSGVDAEATERVTTLVIEAPLPAAALLNPQDDWYNGTPQTTCPTHLERVVTVPDPIAGTQWSRTPKPTHFVQDSQLPHATSESLRDNAPRYYVRCGWQSGATLTGSVIFGLRHTGVFGPVFPLGGRGVLSIVGTNGLEVDRFTQSSTGSQYQQPYSVTVCTGTNGWTGACNRWGSQTRFRTVYLPQGRAVNVFSGRATNSDVPLLETANVWSAHGSRDNWVQVDFSRPVSGINGIVIKGDGTTYHMRTIKVLGSTDGVNFTHHATVTTTSQGALDIFDVTPFDARIVRLENTSNWGDSYATTLSGVELLKRS